MKKNSDPFAKREALRYEKPIPSREMILETLQHNSKPATQEKLQKLLNLKKPSDNQALSKRLAAMERDGQIIRNRKNEYGPVSKMNLIAGRISAHREGYGFVIPDDGSDDLFMPAKYMRAVFDGDKVLVRLTNIDKRGRKECALVQVLEFFTHHVVGRLQKDFNGKLFVVPDNKKITHDILVLKGQTKDAHPGQIVSIQILCQPTYHQQPSGKITEILGEDRAPGMEIDIAIRSHDLPDKFPKEVLAQIKSSALFKLPKNKTTNATNLLEDNYRVDLRTLPFVTIDGEDAMDFDDAIYCEKKSRGGFRLIVAIADVSHYVKPETPLDIEAKSRGNSVYFPGRVIPMLPEILSNELCSLKPNCDRLTLVCDMSLDSEGEIIRYRFYSAVIYSHARLTYTEVAAMVEGHSAFPYESLQHFYALYLLLLGKRKERGALEFDTIETKILFDTHQKIQSIVPVVRNTAHKMIEEAMLCANVCTAKFLIKHKVPGVFRIHEGPTEEKLNDLKRFLKEFGLGLQGGQKPSPKDYAKLLQQISGKKNTSVIQTVLLRSLKQAIYSMEQQGHFGLAYDSYTHFTSPIRRYPDLYVHRLIKSILQNESSPFHLESSKIALMAEHCSFTERRADEATRDAVAALKCEYMSAHVGKIFSGHVTGVTGFGLFVELDNIYIDGLVHITALPADYYIFDATKHRLRGEHAGRLYCLGDALQVKVVRVDIDDKKIDLELAQTLSKPKKRSSKNVKQKKSSE